LDLTRIDTSPGVLDHALVGLFREASLRDGIAVLVAPEELDGDGRDTRLRAFANRIDQATVPVVVVTTRDGIELRSARPTVRIDWRVPDPAPRAPPWRDVTADFGVADHAALRHSFRIGAGAIGRAASSARASASK